VSFAQDVVRSGRRALKAQASPAQSMLFTFVILTLKIQLRKHDEVAAHTIKYKR
jgi:hypothetical protein